MASPPRNAHLLRSPAATDGPFRDGQHVRLRSRVHDTYYLHADDDGESVSISRRRYSLNAAWTVHIYHGDGSHLLLHSAAYGRYLAAASAGVVRPLRLPRRAARLRPAGAGSHHVAGRRGGLRVRGGVLLRNIGGCYLCAGGRLRRYLRWNTRVSLEYTDNVSATMHWIVEPIRPRARPPLIPGPIRTRVPGDLSVIMLGRKAGAWWRIRFVRASDEGLYNEDGWSALRIRGRSVPPEERAGQPRRRHRHPRPAPRHGHVRPSGPLREAHPTRRQPAPRPPQRDPRYCGDAVRHPW
ncbi:hypothetical protein ZWY2020_050451 [Hordeum vulgare]|nr:hypothetical protein ZWY2020_050451 [Hordeum vulgare]